MLDPVCRYLCKLSDQELRQSAARNMADLMWSTVKEPLDSALCFDKESLDLAFKYFMSPTLTMRLAGLSQITVSHSQRDPTRWLRRINTELNSRPDFSCNLYLMFPHSHTHEFCRVIVTSAQLGFPRSS